MLNNDVIEFIRAKNLPTLIEYNATSALER